MGPQCNSPGWLSDGSSMRLMVVTCPRLCTLVIGRCGRGLFPQEGGVISTNVLACYRESASNESAAVMRSGENVRDFLRLAEVFRKRYPGFSSDRARQIAAHAALRQASRFSALNDTDSAKSNWRLWVENCSWLDRLKEGVRPWVRRVFGGDRAYQR